MSTPVKPLSLRATRTYNIWWEEGEEHFVKAMYDWYLDEIGAEPEEWDLSEAVLFATHLCDGGDLDTAVSIEDEDYEELTPPADMVALRAAHLEKRKDG